MLNKITKFSAIALVLTTFSTTAFAATSTTTYKSTKQSSSPSYDDYNNNYSSNNYNSRTTYNADYNSPDDYGYSDNYDQSTGRQAFIGISGGGFIGAKMSSGFGYKPWPMDSYKAGIVIGAALQDELMVELEGVYGQLAVNGGSAPLLGTNIGVMGAILSVSGKLNMPLSPIGSIGIGALKETVNDTIKGTGANDATDKNKANSNGFGMVVQAKLGAEYEFTREMVARVDYEVGYMFNGGITNNDNATTSVQTKTTPKLYHGPRVTLMYKFSM